jgi:hypothetical protein
MKPFSIIAAIIFLLMALAHLYRIAVGFPIMIGGTDIGQGVSWAGLVVASVMAVGLFREGMTMRGKPHHITLVAELDPADSKKIIVRPKTFLPKGDGEHQFHFKIDDQTEKNVRFGRLTAADDCSTCPPDPTKRSTQIYDVDPPGGRTAKFRNRNNNEPPQPQPMDVSYQWEFTCDSGATVEPFDPIISNGGKM